MSLLDVRGISTFYGMSHILFDVSLEVESGEIIGLLGRNGAGKSTTFRSIIGLNPPKSGKIQFKGEDIAGKPPYLIAKKGIGYVPEEKRIFSRMTVMENLEVGIKNSYLNESQWTMDKVFDLFPVLKEYRNRMAGRLSGGEQQMLTIARSLMGNPELLLLDEPTTGLSPLIVKDLKDNVLKLSKNMSVLLAEQNVKFAISLCKRIYVVEKGSIKYEAMADELSKDEKALQEYLTV